MQLFVLLNLRLAKSSWKVTATNECFTGDIAKAFGAGADFVMLGGMFAGHNEGDGDIIEKDGKKSPAFMSWWKNIYYNYNQIQNIIEKDGKSKIVLSRPEVDKIIRQKPH